MTDSALLPVAILGGVVGMDVVSFPQAMISRPIVAATLAGALAGNPTAGLLVGAALEMLAMEMLPVGASRYPEWGSAAVAGGAIAASAQGPHGVLAGGLVLGVLTALGAAWLGGWAMHGLRRLNGAWSVRARARLEGGDAGVVTALQLRGLVADFARAAVTTAAVVWLAQRVARRFMPQITAGSWLTIGLIAALGAGVAGSTAWRLAAGAPRARWLAAVGLGIGAAAAAGLFAGVFE